MGQLAPKGGARVRKEVLDGEMRVWCGEACDKGGLMQVEGANGMGRAEDSN